METMRKLGNYVDFLAKKKGLTSFELSQVMNCSEIQVERFLKGIACASFQQLEALASALDVSVSELLRANFEHYEHTVVEVEGRFSESANREKVLDMIYDYVDVVDSCVADRFRR